MVGLISQHLFRSTCVSMCPGEAEEVGAEPADQDSPQEV